MKRPYAEIGVALRQRRETKGLSRRGLVDRLGRDGIRTSVSSLQDLELGRRFNLRIVTGLAAALGCPLEEFLGLGVGTLKHWRCLVETSRHLTPDEKKILQEALGEIERGRREEARTSAK